MFADVKMTLPKLIAREREPARVLTVAMMEAACRPARMDAILHFNEDSAIHCDTSHEVAPTLNRTDASELGPLLKPTTVKKILPVRGTFVSTTDEGDGDWKVRTRVAVANAVWTEAAIDLILALEPAVDLARVDVCDLQDERSPALPPNRVVTDGANPNPAREITRDPVVGRFVRVAEPTPREEIETAADRDPVLCGAVERKRPRFKPLAAGLLSLAAESHNQTTLSLDDCPSRISRETSTRR